MPLTNITQQEIFRAQQTIQGLAAHTPLLSSPALTAQVGVPVQLKLETMQEIGAFKVRGAAHKILSLSAEERANGVVTASTGNHGRAVAYVAQKLGLRAVVCLSHLVPQNKVAALEQLGADVVIHGQSQDDAAVRAGELEAEEGLTYIPPFDDPHIIAGQGTIGLEILQDYPAVRTVLVPLSGGGLIAGIALVLKAANPAIRVIGVSMERAAVMAASLDAGRPLQMPEEPTLADSLQGGIGLDNRFTFKMVQQYVDDVILVSEEEIAAAMAFALHKQQLVLEGAGAVGIAALQSGKVDNLAENAVLVLSGRNVDLGQLFEIAQNSH